MATAEQAKSLPSIAGILDISDTGNSSIEENIESPDLKALLVDLAEEREAARSTASAAAATADSDGDDAETQEDFDEDEEDWESPRVKAARVRKANEDLQAIELLGKFVSLVDILPPLPKKGDFKVEAIKASQYFFS